MRVLLSCLVAGILLYPWTAMAGAWTQAENKAQIILNGWYYSTDSLYTNAGNKASQGTYRKYELNPYMEYGLTDDVTLGANLSFQRASQDVSGGTLVNWGLGDSEFFARLKLWEAQGFVLSAEPLLKLPSPSTGAMPVLGGKYPDAGLGVSAGYGFSLFDQHHYANIDMGYRYRFGDPENQMRYAATLGIGVTKNITIMPQAFITRRTQKPSVVSFTQSSGDDFNLTKLQLSAVYDYREDISFQIGGFSHVDGNNVGAGDGALLAVWKKF